MTTTFKEFWGNIDWKKQLQDQFAHFIAGLLATLILIYIVSIYVAPFLVLAFSIGREIYQRLQRKDKWYSCGWGCRLDLVFWCLGILLAALLYIFVL